MSISELLKTVGEREMSRKDFLRFVFFVIVSLIGLKNLLSLIANVNLHSDIRLDGRPDSVADDSSGGYNGGRYNG